MITQTLQLNLVPKGVWPRLYVSQYDAGSRTLTFEIYNGDQRFTLTSGTTAKIQGTKPDRHGFSYDADVDTSNNVITADITQQMTAAHGEAYCELVLFKSGQRIGTLNFVMMIQQAGLNDETDTSDSDLPDIIAEATEQMLTAEAYAKGTRNGTAVTSGQTGYHDNSKYYKEQAATQASNASTSATSANTNALKAEGYAVGKQNGTTQTSGTYYHNNAQYYKEQAASSATTASTKAGEASTSANTASQKASAASTSAQTASDKALVAEGYAKGTQNGTPVGSTSPYYHNNAEYFKDLANPTVAANVSFNNSGTEMSSTNVQDGIVENRTSIQNLSNLRAEMGAHNILPLTVENVLKAWKDSNYIVNGYSVVTNNNLTVTLIVKDGKISKFHVEGTPSSDTYVDIITRSLGLYTPIGSYILSGCPNGGSNIKYQLYLRQATSPIIVTREYGNGAQVDFSSNNNYSVTILVNANQTINADFYPMLRDAKDASTEYQPYAKTNVELTKDIELVSGRQLPIIDLGTSYTQELKQDISSGAFKKAVVGGKLTINNHVYYLAHPDYWLNTGDTKCTTHHMLVVPAGNLGTGKMNSDNSTAGGYAGSGLKSGTNHDDTANTALTDVAAIIKADFGAANILTHREYFTNALANGKPSAGAWYDSDIDLMNENMVYGTNIFAPHSDGSTIPYVYTIDKTQIKLFEERPDLITIITDWWLRDAVSAERFVFNATNGLADIGNASGSRVVRPAFAIC